MYHKRVRQNIRVLVLTNLTAFGIVKTEIILMAQASVRTHKQKDIILYRFDSKSIFHQDSKDLS